MKQLSCVSTLAHGFTVLESVECKLDCVRTLARVLYYLP